MAPCRIPQPDTPDGSVEVSSRVGIWSVGEGGAARVDRSCVNLEIDLETWIEDHPALLAEGLRVIGRQVHVDGGFIDLLCVDIQGRWVIVELKRARLYRDAVAQAIDYAWSIRSMSAEALRDLVANTTIDVDPLDLQYDDPSERDVAIIVAGAGIDPGLERVVGFLAHYDVPVRVVTFEVFQLASGEQLLVREIIDDEVVQPQARNVAGSRSVEEISLLGQSESTKRAFDRIVRAAEARGLFARPYKRGVMIAPGHMRNRFLMYLKPEPNRGLRVSHGPEAFAEFYPDLTATDVEEALGESKRYLDGEELAQQVEIIEEFLSELPEVTQDADQCRADAATVIPLAALVRPGEWTTYGELSIGAIGRSSAAQTIGNIARTRDDFPTPHRVLNVRGVVPQGWRSAAGDGPGECRRRLENDGVVFRADGSADPAQKVSGEELRSRLQQSSTEPT